MSRAYALWRHLLTERGDHISGIARKLGWGRKTVRRHLRTLLEQNRAVRLASGRDSSWTRPPIYVAMTCNESEAEK